MWIFRLCHRACSVAGVMALTAALTACSTPTSPKDTRLRVFNSGAVAIQGLVIQFPASTVTFGTVSAGTTTTYLQVPNGVYAYGAFLFVVDGILVRQPVIDWVGESPLDGTAFTYSLELVTSPSGGSMIRLTKVSRDE